MEERSRSLDSGRKAKALAKAGTPPWKTKVRSYSSMLEPDQAANDDGSRGDDYQASEAQRQWAQSETQRNRWSRQQKVVYFQDGGCSARARSANNAKADSSRRNYASKALFAHNKITDAS